MRNKLRVLLGQASTVGALAACMILTSSARADTFDTTLASPDNTGANSNNPSYYNGSGNPQGGWTIDSEHGIEVGLRAKIRNGAEIDSPGSDDYVVPAGPYDGLHPTYALWNYEFSIDLRPGGAGTLTLSDIAATLTITDLTTGGPVSVDPLTKWTDNFGFGSAPGGAGDVTSVGKHKPQIAADWGVQNSENLGFGDSPLAGFDPNSSDTYKFDLVVTDTTASHNILAQTDMEVTPTPEPSAVILMSILALPLFFLARRKKNASLR